MQIEIDKKTGLLLGVIGVLLVAVVGLAIQNNHTSSVETDTMHNHMGMNSSANSSLNGAEVMFLQMMIPHHQQAIDISNLALKTTSDAELKALAKSIIEGQSAEIVQMKAWLDGAGATMEMGHSMGMGGMLTDSELSALEGASGSQFDKLWLEGMVGHHEGAIHMTTMIADVENAELRAFAKNIVSVQSAQIAQMKKMLKRIA